MPVELNSSGNGEKELRRLILLPLGVRHLASLYTHRTYYGVACSTCKGLACGVVAMLRTLSILERSYALARNCPQPGVSSSTSAEQLPLYRPILAASYYSPVFGGRIGRTTAPFRRLPFTHGVREWQQRVVRVSWGFLQPVIPLAYRRAESSDTIGRPSVAEGSSLNPLPMRSN